MFRPTTHIFDKIPKLLEVCSKLVEICCQLYFTYVGGTKIPKSLETQSIPKNLEILESIPKILEILY